MGKIFDWLKSAGIIYISFVITGAIYYIYIYTTGFHGDIGQFYTYIMFMAWGIIASFISLFIYKFIFFIFYGSYKIQNYILVLGLSFFGVINIGVWGYGNFLFDKGLLSGNSFIEFGFYQPEYLLLIMHTIFYIFVGVIIKYGSIFAKNPLTKN